MKKTGSYAQRFRLQFVHNQYTSETGDKMKIYYYTFGCKVNQYETENIKELFCSKGHDVCEDFRKADICLVNSCTVTSEADKKCRQLIRRIRNQNPDCILICAGCMTQAHNNISELLPECDIIVGSRKKSDIPVLTEQFINTGERIIMIGDLDNDRKIEPMHNSFVDDKTRAYIKIQDGCDMSCSYCIIPRARGHICSKSLDSIKKEAADLIASGHKELILTGINLSCYGREQGNSIRLADAVETVCSLDGDFRVRLGSLEPELLTEKDIARLASAEKLCPQFHLSLQSGSDRILALMRRRYTSADYAVICGRLRTFFPGCALTTDIMVGFPTESEEDHKASLEFVKQIGFSDAHIFTYSQRPGTDAAAMNGQIDGAVKHRRAEEMQEITALSREKYLRSMIGTVQRVLFEKENSPDRHQGHSANYILVTVPRTVPDISLRRRYLNVKITGSDNESCCGEIAEDIN